MPNESVDRLEIIKRVGGVVVGILGQAPWITTITGKYSISLYQPAIYDGKELFLVVPMMVAVIATWAVTRWQSMMWVIFLVFLLLAGIIYWIFITRPLEDPLHFVNWILSYCAFSLFVAALYRAGVDLFE